MIPFDTLCAAWRAERAYRMARYAVRPRLGEEGLTLGPMTVIAKRGASRWGEPKLQIEGSEDQILALLTVAYWRPTAPETIDTLHRVSKALASRNPTLAPILIAQAELGPIESDERTAFRLFCAAKLLDAGVTPQELVKGLGLVAAPRHGLAKYAPDQPRVAAGTPDGGQWTAGGTVPSDTDTVTPDNLPVTHGDLVQVADNITGFTNHGLNQAINRSVSPAAMMDAVVRPLQILPQANGTTRYVGDSAVVVLNPAGAVVTTWRTR